MTCELPLSGLNNPSPRLATTSEGKSYLLYLPSVSPNYANAMQISLRVGRFFTADDRPGSPRVAVINEQFQKDVFGDRIRLGSA